MIFVTVGTHEQPFDRLIREVDRLRSEGVISEDVMIQTGVSKYHPKSCQFENALPYEEMQHLMQEARIVITHGGPSSFMPVLQYGKIPIVVPRRLEYHEHVNNHQVRFCHEEEKKYHNILLIDDIEKLGEAITAYDEQSASMKSTYQSHTKEFNQGFQQVIGELFSGK